MTRTKPIALITTITICSMISAPVFAEQEETSPKSVIVQIQDDIDSVDGAVNTESDNTSGSETDEISTKDTAEKEVSENEDTEDEVKELSEEKSEEPGALPSEDNLTEDDEEYLAGDWYEWDKVNSVLTLRGQLPNTYYDNETNTYNNLATLAGINRSDVKKIIITNGTKAGSSAKYMFCGMKYLEEIDGLRNLDTSKVTDMGCMFSGCGALTSIDLSGFDTSNVVDMKQMFGDCGYLTSLDLSNFDTSKVWNMDWMFCYCKALTSLDLSGFDTSKVSSMDCMFIGCESLSMLNLSSFDTGNVTEMECMFYKCKNLGMLDLTSFDTSNVTYMGCMFGNCESLMAVFVSERWSTKKVWYSKDMFENCYMLTGGNDTIYDSSKTDKEYARIDEEGKPGYLTFRGVYKPTVVIKTAFGGKTVQFNCVNSGAEIYYQTGSSNITLNSKHVKAGETVFFNKPMIGADAAIYFKAFYNGKWSSVGKWGLLNVNIDKPIIIQSGPKSENNFKIYTQTKESYIVYTLDGTNPAIEEGTQQLKVTNGKIIWGTSGVVNVPKGRTVKAVAIRCGLVTSDVMTYTNK